MAGLISICHTTNILGVSGVVPFLTCYECFLLPAAMMPGYAPYMYAMAGRNGYRTRTRDGYLTGKIVIFVPLLTCLVTLSCFVDMGQ